MGADAVTLAFTVYGVPQQMGSKRAFVPKGWTRPIITDSNRNLKSWQSLVAEGANRAIGELPGSERGLIPKSAGVRMHLAFYLPRPAKHHKPVFVPMTSSPDVDKLERAILDALSGVVYQDDSQVTEVIKGKYYAPVGNPPRVDVRVEPAPMAASNRVFGDKPLFDEGLFV